MSPVGRSALVLLSGVLLLACSGGGPPDDQPPVSIVLQVEGMHCDSCSSAITQALEGVDGVLSAAADHEAGTAEAVYRADTVKPEELEAAIEDLGYTVTTWTKEGVMVQETVVS